MLRWFRKRSRLEKLQDRYAELMKKSFDVALKDKKKSEEIHEQAHKVFKEIKHLSAK